MTPPPPPQNPMPSISSLNPTSARVGGGGFLLAVNGSGFIASSRVRWNGADRVTTFVSGSELMAQIPAVDISAVGTANVTVVNPSPGGGVSAAATFTVGPRPPPGVGVVELISVATDGSPSNGNSFTPPAVSADGRFVAFQSDALNLVPGPASGFSDIYVRDTCLGAPVGCTPATIRVSVSSAGALADGNSRSPAMSGDGRFVAFDSSATNLVPNDTNGPFAADVFVRDTCIGAPAGCAPATTRVSVATDGTEANNDSRGAAISADGRLIVFSSGATNLTGDANPGGAVVRDTCVNAPAGCTPTTFRASVASNGTQDGTGSGIPSISSTGRFITFLSFATFIVPSDTNGEPDAFVRDICLAAGGCLPSTTRVSLGNDGSQGNALTDNSRASVVTVDGRFVAFTSFASNLVSGDSNGLFDVFLRDICVGAPAGCVPSTSRISVAFNGAEADQGSGEPTISGDGRFIAFASLASNLVPGFTSSPKGIYLRDSCVNGPPGCAPTTVHVSVAQDGGFSGVNEFPSISTDGRFVAFMSNGDNLIPTGSNGNVQIFLARTGF